MKLYNLTTWEAYCQEIGCKWCIECADYHPGKDAGLHSRKTGHDVLVRKIESWIYKKEDK